MCMGVACGVCMNENLTNWKSKGNPDLFTCEHLLTRTVLCVLFCSSAPGRELTEEPHPLSVSF